MKYCTKCGAEIFDEAVICPKCGCAIATQPLTPPQQSSDESSDVSGLKVAAQAFMIIGCVVMGMGCLPLCWTIPMTVHYCKSIKEHKKISTGFKVCSLLFVSFIGGILMLADTND